MDNAVEVCEYRGFAIIIEMDEFSGNPREEFDHLFKFVLSSRTIECMEIDGVNADSMPQWVEDHWNSHYVFSVYAHIHSSIALSSAPFSCPWDSGVLGFACVEKEAFHKEYGASDSNMWTREQLTTILNGELAELESYMNGEVYSYRIVAVPTAKGELSMHDADILSDMKTNKIEDIGGCGGFLGVDTEELCSMAEAEIDGIIANYKDEVVERLKVERATELPDWLAKKLRRKMRATRIKIKQLTRRSQKPAVKLILGDKDVEAYCKFRTSQLNHDLETLKSIYHMKQHANERIIDET